MRQRLLDLRSQGYKYLYFSGDEPDKVWAVDICWPGDDIITIDRAIALGSPALRGRKLCAA